MWKRLRHLAGRLFGFHAEIDALKGRIQELSWDRVFGMWTRNAFLQFCKVMPRGERTVVFIDLDRIHALNHRLGYAEVDRRVKGTFSIPLRSSDIVARWFSGDEIVILFDTNPDSALTKVREIEASAAEHGLTFTFAVGTWEVGVQGIEDVVTSLSTEARKRRGRRLARRERRAV